MSLPDDILAAPFPWFGGKTMQAELVWQRFGSVVNYVEPFAGSLGVLLNRPGKWAGPETINDLSGMVVNFWRCVRFKPAELAEWCDHPVSNLDLWARHDWLIVLGDLSPQLEADPMWCDPKIAGWWCWGLCCWIGSGWCSRPSKQRVSVEGVGVHRTHRKRVSVEGVGVHRTHRKRVHLADSGRGVHRTNRAGATTQRELVDGWVDDLAARLRRVRMLCGDWSKAVSSGVLSLSRGRKIGVYLDPPYAYDTGRDADLYAEDSATVADDVRAWCAANGDNPNLRIALAGYDTEHAALEALGWSVASWDTHGLGYGGMGDDSAGRANAKRERVWFSPHCLAVDARQPSLF
jgi:hypothetical protein